MISIAPGELTPRREVRLLKRSFKRLCGQRIIALFIDIPDIYREQILLHEVGIMLQVYRNNDISPQRPG